MSAGADAASTSAAHDGPTPAEPGDTPRAKVASQIRAFQTLADECDVDWDDATWAEIHQLMEIEEIFQHNSVDDQGQILMDVDILLADLDSLFDVAPEDQPWSKQQIRELMTTLKERGRSSFIRKYVIEEGVPIPKLLTAFNVDLCPELRTLSNRTLVYFLQLAMHRELSAREKLAQYNSIRDAVQLIQQSKRILILTGAGISVSCGIPDFRSRDGLYASLTEYELDDPQQMFDITYFREKPSVFYSFASKIYPSNFIPSPCHRFIKLVEDKGKLLRNYTQNIDTLETLTGVKTVIQCHGSFASASCIECHHKVPGKDIEAAIMRRTIPLCTVCHPPHARSSKKKKKKSSRKKAKGQWDSDCSDESDGPEFPTGIMKPDITFFGEKLSDVFDRSLEADREQVDLMLIIGTSLKVSPVADLISHIPHSIPQILINKTPIRHINPDIVLLGNADAIIEHLADELNWELPPPVPPTQAPKTKTSPHPPVSDPPTPPPPSEPVTPPLSIPAIPPQRSPVKKIEDLLNKPLTPMKRLPTPQGPQRVGDSHVWLFEGAEGGKWLADFERMLSMQTSSKTNGVREEDENRRETKRVKLDH